MSCMIVLEANFFHLPWQAYTKTNNQEKESKYMNNLFYVFTVSEQHTHIFLSLYYHYSINQIKR